MLNPEQPEWYIDALCAQTDPEMFFPEKGSPATSALRVCRKCPVSAACLQYAMDTDERYGVWGGTTAQQRRRMRQGISFVKSGRASDDWHGKPNGVRKHWILGTKPCEACRRANKLYRQELALRRQSA